MKLLEWADKFSEYRTGQGDYRYSLLQNIRDNYEKIVLSLEPGLDASYDGIRSENLIDWLLSQ